MIHKTKTLIKTLVTTSHGVKVEIHKSNAQTSE